MRSLARNAFLLIAWSVQVGVFANAESATESPVTIEDDASLRKPGATETEPDAATEHSESDGTIDAVPSNPEADETEPLIPIETQNSIRVNANVSLPQDI